MNFSLCNFLFFFCHHTHPFLQSRSFANNFGVEVRVTLDLTQGGVRVCCQLSLLYHHHHDPTAYIKHCYWHNEEDKWSWVTQQYV